MGVDRIPQNRVSEVAHVDADLVGAPGQDPTADERTPVMLSDNFVIGDRFFAVRW